MQSKRGIERGTNSLKGGGRALFTLIPILHVMNGFPPGTQTPDSVANLSPTVGVANVSLMVGVEVAVVLLLLLLGAIVATAFCVVAYRKRRAVPNKSDPEPVFEVVKPPQL